jgi:hypothetical protein
MTGQLPPLPPGYQLEQPPAPAAGNIPPLPPGYRLESREAQQAYAPPVPRPAAPQLSPSEEMPVAAAEENSKGNVGKTLRELGAPAAAGLAIGGGAGAFAPPLAYGAGYATEAAAPIARALAPIAKKYGIKALEGAGLAYGWHLYRELKSVFEGE